MQKAGLKRGVMIVENPQTGEILAMVSLPTYDNNAFAHRDQLEGLQDAAEEPGPAAAQPRDQRAVPAGLDVQARHRARAPWPTRSSDRPSSSRPSRTSSSARRSSGTGTSAGFGRLHDPEGFAHSSDTFFYQVAQRLGIDRLAYWARQFGFGAPTGIDLPGEASGHRADQPVEEGHASASRSTRARSYQAGIGQGYDAVTPLQLINAYAALANGGTLYQPQVVRADPRPGRHGRPAVQAEASSARSTSRRPTSRSCASRPARS